MLQKLVPEKKVFEVHIEPGHRNNSKVVLRGEAGCSDPDMQPGDVVFILEARPHKTFRRIASDLVFEKVIPCVSYPSTGITRGHAKAGLQALRSAFKAAACPVDTWPCSMRSGSVTNIQAKTMPKLYRISHLTHRHVDDAKSHVKGQTQSSAYALSSIRPDMQ